MRPAIILVAATAYVMHMTFGCCFAHEHGPEAPASLAGKADPGHRCPSHGTPSPDGSEAPPSEAPHDHSGHHDNCLATPASTGNSFDDGGTALTLDLGNSLVPVAKVGCSAQPELGTEAPLPLPVRAHLAKLVLTI